MDREFFNTSSRLSLPAVLVLALVITACSAKEPPSLEEQAQNIDKQLICPVCPAETIDQAQVPLAQDMRTFIREKLAQGWTKQQILDYFSAPERYGLSVLSEPPKTGANLILWVVPPIGVLLGLLLVFSTIRAMQRRRPCIVDVSPEDAKLESYLRRIDREMKDGNKSPPYKTLISKPKANQTNASSTDDKEHTNG